MFFAVGGAVVEGGGAAAVEIEGAPHLEAGHQAGCGEDFGEFAEADAVGEAEELAVRAVGGDEGAGGVLHAFEAGDGPAGIDKTWSGLEQMAGLPAAHLGIPEQLRMGIDHDGSGEQRACLPGTGFFPAGDHESHGFELGGEEAAVHSGDGPGAAHAFEDFAAARPVLRLVDDAELAIAVIEEDELQIDGVAATADAEAERGGMAAERLALGGGVEMPV